MKNSKQTLSENSFILLISMAIVKIIGAFFKIPLATDTFLGDVGFGYYSVAHDIYMPFYTLAISGLPCSLSHITAQYLADKNYSAVAQNYKQTKKLFLILGTVFSLGVTALSVPIVILSNAEQNTFLSVIAVVPSIFFCFIISLYRGYFEGFNDMYPTAISKLIEAVFKLICGLLFSYIVIKITNNPAFAAAAAMCAVSLGTIVSTIYLSKKFKFKNPIGNLSLDSTSDKKSSIGLKVIFLAAVPYAIASLASSVIAVIDVLTVKTYISNADVVYLENISKGIAFSPTELSTFLYGVRSKAFTIYHLIPTITMSLGISALPLIAELSHKNEHLALSKNVNFSLKLICSITFPASMGLIVLSGEIMQLLYSSSDVLSDNLLLLYGVCSLFAGLAVPLTTEVQALGQQKFLIKTICIGVLIKIITAFAFVMSPNIHIYSAPLSTLACYIYISVALLITISKKTQTISFKDTMFKPLISALICGFSAFLISKIGDSSSLTLVAIFVAIVVYFAMIIITKTFTKEEISYIPIINKLLK